MAIPLPYRTPSSASHVLVLVDPVSRSCDDDYAHFVIAIAVNSLCTNRVPPPHPPTLEFLVRLVSICVYEMPSSPIIDSTVSPNDSLPAYYGSDSSPALRQEIDGHCLRARATTIHLPHGDMLTPMFMPVGTQASVKGLVPQQFSNDTHVILANTYHLALRPGPEEVDRHGGLHGFMRWSKGILTDSGGFQMVSLAKFSQVTEKGVRFESPVDGGSMILTPEKSMEIQNLLGADIIMALDDVVASKTTGDRVREACERTMRWLDRCNQAHAKKHKQSLFGIVQGGLDDELRKWCCQEMVKRDLPGYAVGGLSGGEAKDRFWRMVNLCTEILPENKPRYCMGVGYPEDLIVCVALGADMFDCVYPARTARFGSALTGKGVVKIRNEGMANDFRKIEEGCECWTCVRYSRSYLHYLKESSVCATLLTIHNIHYLTGLMGRARRAILEGVFSEFVREFMKGMYSGGKYPEWSRDALRVAGIELE